jgi:chemotaxis signal transduction protein
MPDYIKGIVNHNGDVCPVVSFDVILNAPHDNITNKTCLVYLNMSEKQKITIAVQADIFIGSLMVSPPDIIAVSDRERWIPDKFAAGYVKTSAGMAVLVNTGLVLQSFKILKQDKNNGGMIHG